MLTIQELLEKLPVQLFEASDVHHANPYHLCITRMPDLDRYVKYWIEYSNGPAYLFRAIREVDLQTALSKTIKEMTALKLIPPL